ncbi:2-amino-4-hydroxy-6-hydroxymethyldihydropteridine diphosphokinase [Parvibaculum sp.]|uniref:2-amino-4-hydroxy-6- hydroxymethyldihydropteridine diphosphokinase n=1 Tax=Parvibaculum sp. TaxID=2024848 RepID=UPI001B1B2560|nr:2-amino-4-hydroxy-6-hydroxymethyldihydropteridine diphosphokinase [Parvibaculum sp.]MBO6633440.1 2-amino-4-hydroxy-6-hydroxymethyldihydropteridine diphosphokinase [Parvibaculum sp.]MBO6680190.1 2-amino-4-hydroxy-6-hydroxymethyldihydropteridine diphosphokinase [Parvibaculum sp.]MBO6685506.1 2-amino-4-hydroxy-6-hydroxymethyldihydropteridine diphosphokinase [Parvibaculum sp.]MBO6903507.1 2-amino-4-hydroxy-6-hydroxymethyldihydropteridine diphosphokinase [Parvibaculum sp.]
MEAQVLSGQIEIFVALGANLPSVYGGPADTLRSALRAMPSFGLRVVRCAPFYETPALASYTQPDYVNSVAVIESALPPESLLNILHRIEALFGRVRRERWAPRSLDIDLLDFRGVVLPGLGGESGQAGAPIALPHPGISGRGFVLLPLRDVAPWWRHPVTGKCVKQLITALPPGECAAIRRIAG